MADNFAACIVMPLIEYEIHSSYDQTCASVFLATLTVYKYVLIDGYTEVK